MDNCLKKMGWLKQKCVELNEASEKTNSKTTRTIGGSDISRHQRAYIVKVSLSQYTERQRLTKMKSEEKVRNYDSSYLFHYLAFTPVGSEYES
ncbi:uncharacterized protein TNIN_319051 [Trichonephila inaurata madagascariensis]|uniref:Uncharacterized protein n=1 Tax=Trichonephila inaurata madagascariensis TaxID=2747483 RepID=A0A8X6MK36_9ARAC|nr:uncharacterized protein TNIN_319051 [Trichonephila inaurata madagascariensis]